MDTIISYRELFICKNISSSLKAFLQMNQFTNIAVLVDKKSSETSVWKQTLRILKKYNHRILFIKETTETMVINQACDLIISVGTRWSHDVAKRSNIAKIYHCAIETTRSWATSYGSGALWTNGKAILTVKIPDTIIAITNDKFTWTDLDLVYYFHCVLLAIEAALNDNADEYIKTNALAGIIIFFQQYHLILANKISKKTSSLLLSADVLMKNAYINIPMSNESKKIIMASKDYFDFERAIVNSAHDLVNYNIEYHKERMESLFSRENYSLATFLHDYSTIYEDFCKHKQSNPFTLDIFDKNMLQTLVEGQKTRRIS